MCAYPTNQVHFGSFNTKKLKVNSNKPVMPPFAPPIDCPRPPPATVWRLFVARKQRPAGSSRWRTCPPSDTGRGTGPAGDKWSQTTQETVGGAGVSEANGVPPGADCLPIRALKLIKWLQCSQGHRQPLRQLYTRRPAGVRNVLKRVSCTPEGPVVYEMRAGHEKPRNRGPRAS